MQVLLQKFISINLSWFDKSFKERILFFFCNFLSFFVNFKFQQSRSACVKLSKIYFNLKKWNVKHFVSKLVHISIIYNTVIVEATRAN